MNYIYQPRGRAFEYSPLALNIYSSCDHFCNYCYNEDRFPCAETARARDIDLRKLEREAKELSNGQSVQLSFVGDPYCNTEARLGLTRKVLEIFLRHEVNTSILTKGGTRCLRDLDLFKQFKQIKVGATLTFVDLQRSKLWESGAADPQSRIDALEVLHDNGIETWVSLEPTIDPQQTLELIDKTHGFVDLYKVGPINHLDSVERCMTKRDIAPAVIARELDAIQAVDWRKFAKDVVRKFEGYGSIYYLKDDLKRWA